MHRILCILSREGCRQHGPETSGPPGNFPQPIHQPLEQSALRILIAIADAHSPRVPPELGRHKQKTQSRRDQGRMLQVIRFELFFPVEEQQPAVQVSCRVPDYAGSLPSNPPWPSFSATFSVWRQIEFGIIRLSSPYWVVKPVRRSHARTFFPKLSNSETFPRHI